MPHIERARQQIRQARFGRRLAVAPQRFCGHRCAELAGQSLRKILEFRRARPSSRRPSWTPCPLLVHADINFGAVHRDRLHFVLREFVKHNRLALPCDPVERTAVAATRQQCALGVQRQTQDVGIFRGKPFLGFAVRTDGENLSIRARAREKLTLLVHDERPDIRGAQFAEWLIKFHFGCLAARGNLVNPAIGHRGGIEITARIERQGRHCNRVGRE